MQLALIFIEKIKNRTKTKAEKKIVKNNLYFKHIFLL